MDAKLRIKMGAVEVEYEGSDDFLKKELPELLKAVLALHASAAESSEPEDDVDDGDEKTKGGRIAGSLSVSTAAAKLGAKKGSDLALAAAAAIVIGQGKDSFSRSDLLRGMQSAKAYYKTTYRSNLSHYISTLVKAEHLLDHGNDSYGLHEAKRKELEKTCA